MTRILCLACRTWLVIVSLLATLLALAVVVIVGFMAGISRQAGTVGLVVGYAIMVVLPGLVGLSVAAFARRLVWPCLIGLSLALVVVAVDVRTDAGWSGVTGGFPLWATVSTLGVVGLVLGTCEAGVRVWSRASTWRAAPRV